MPRTLRCYQYYQFPSKNVLIFVRRKCNEKNPKRHGALSLYSTATQNTWRRGLALGNAPDARILRWRYQHVGIFLPNAKICVFPDANPQRQSVEYRLRWDPTQPIFHLLASCWPCTFHVFCVDFICVWYPTRTPFPVEYGL